MQLDSLLQLNFKHFLYQASLIIISYCNYISFPNKIVSSFVNFCPKLNNAQKIQCLLVLFERSFKKWATDYYERGVHPAGREDGVTVLTENKQI